MAESGTWRQALVPGLLLVVVLSGCGGGGGDAPTVAPETTSSSTPVASPAAAAGDPCDVLSAADLSALLTGAGGTEALTVTSARLARDTCGYTVLGNGGSSVDVQLNARPGDYDDRVRRLGVDGVMTSAVTGLGDQAVSFVDLAGEHLAARTAASFVEVSSGSGLESTVGSPGTSQDLLRAVAAKVLGGS